MTQIVAEMVFSVLLSLSPLKPCVFTRDVIIVRSIFVYKFSLTVTRVKVSSFQGQQRELISRYDVLDI